MMETMRLKLSRDEARRRAFSMPGILSGRSPDGQNGDMAKAFAMSIAVTIMGDLKTAFVTKARGGTDLAGEKWKPLAPSTIHNRRMKKGKAGEITKRNKAAWRRLRSAERAVRTAKTFRATLTAEIRLREAEKKLAKARKDYWGAVDSIEILRDTGYMFNSLSPGVGGNLNPGGVLDVTGGLAVFGTAVPYAKRHHYGDGRCPQRRLWPVVSKWPGVWWDNVNATIRRGVLKASRVIMRAA